MNFNNKTGQVKKKPYKIMRNQYGTTFKKGKILCFNKLEYIFDIALTRMLKYVESGFDKLRI